MAEQQNVNFEKVLTGTGEHLEQIPNLPSGTPIMTFVPAKVNVTTNTLAEKSRVVSVVMDILPEFLPVAPTGEKQASLPMVENPAIYVRFDFEGGANIYQLLMTGPGNPQMYAITVHGEVIKLPPYFMRTIEVSTPVTPATGVGVLKNVASLIVVVPFIDLTGKVPISVSFLAEEGNLGETEIEDIEFEMVPNPNAQGGGQR